MQKYDHKKIEKKWQKAWAKSGIYKTKESKSGEKPKSYVLDMFPYPSGAGLHVGHPRGYIATDAYSRFKTMNGFNVLHPMGWDAFGLPAEEFAIKNKIHPSVAVKKNIATFKEQLSILGLNYDWSREVNTTDPEYYKWTQWAFLQMHKKGLTYESHEPINWCPSCKTGLANEDLEDGKCERCGSVVEKKPIRQWVIGITKYADRLLKDIDGLNWPESIKESQRNWIGRSEGAEIDFKIKNSDVNVKVFTTRADTLFGVTYIVLAPESHLLEKLQSSVSNFDEVSKYIAEAKKKTVIERTAEGKEKSGVRLKGLSAINPANGEEVEVWVADYVLADYGTGAVMAVPAHDERDFQFAKKHGLEIKEVVIPRSYDDKNPHVPGKETIFRKTILGIIFNPKNGKYVGLKWKKQPWTTFVIGGIEDNESPEEAARREIFEETGFKNLKFRKILGGPVQAEFFAAHKDVNRITHSWYVVFDLENEDKEELSDEENEKHEVIWLDRKDITRDRMTHSELDIVLDRLENGVRAFNGSGILIDSAEFNGMKSDEAVSLMGKKYGKSVVKYKLRDWVFSRQRYWGEPIPLIHCGKCGVVPVPEKELPLKLPNVKSYEPTGTGESPLAGISKWVNTKCPSCKGPAKRETNTMPQWAGSCWYYLRYIDPKNKKVLVDPNKEKYWQPVDMYVGGAEHATRHLIYARFWHKFLYDIGVVSTKEPFMQLKNQGLIAGPDGRKMSKRYGNVINPNDVVNLYGADTLRVYEMFMGPFDQGIAWSTDNMIGSRRFVEKVWRLGEKVSVGAKNPPAKLDSETESLLHRTIKKVGEDIESFSFNTAISSLMILTNALEKVAQTEANGISKEVYKTLLQLMSPFAPHMTEEIWQSMKLGEGKHEKSIHTSKWPEFDAKKLHSNTYKIAVQINSKVRAVFEIDTDEESEVVKKALSIPEIIAKLEGKEPKKVIYVKGKLVNLVV